MKLNQMIYYKSIALKIIHNKNKISNKMLHLRRKETPLKFYITFNLNKLH